MHKNLGEDRTYSSEDMIADRQTNTHTQTQTDTLIAILRAPLSRRSKKRKVTDDVKPGRECLPAPHAQTERQLEKHSAAAEAERDNISKRYRENNS